MTAWKACCHLWDDNPLIAQNGTAHARLDAFPVVPGHALVIPYSHIESFAYLDQRELIDLHALVRRVCELSGATSHTIAVNDGRDAGRTVDHLHIHVIPRRPGDVADPRGGVRRLFGPSTDDPWLTPVEAS